MVREITLTSLYSGFLLFILGIIAFVTGQPFVFPSLGPTAYILSKIHYAELVVPRRVIGSHTIAVVAGQITYRLFAGGTVVTETMAEFSPSLFLLSVSAVLSVVLTSAGMIATNTSHPPACATTLIISLGLLPTPSQGGIIIVSVVVLVVMHELVLLFAERTGLTPVPEDSPMERSPPLEES